MIYLLICSEIQFEEEEGMEEKEEENEEEKEERKAEVQKEVIGAVWCSVELMLPWGFQIYYLMISRETRLMVVVVEAEEEE